MQPTLRPKEIIDGTHPASVALGQIVIHGDDVDALAFECIQIHGERGDQGFAFAGFHFGDHAGVQNNAAHQLHIEVALAKGALRGFPHGGESFRQKVVGRFAGG